MSPQASELIWNKGPYGSEKQNSYWIWNCVSIILLMVLRNTLNKKILLKYANLSETKPRWRVSFINLRKESFSDNIELTSPLQNHLFRCWVVPQFQNLTHSPIILICIKQFIITVKKKSKEEKGRPPSAIIQARFSLTVRSLNRLQVPRVNNGVVLPQNGVICRGGIFNSIAEVRSGTKRHASKV